MPTKDFVKIRYKKVLVSGGLEAKDLRMIMRGVEKQNSVMTTSVIPESFRSDPKTREEFLNLPTKKTYG